MTYITDQTSEELRAHMKRITSMEGWSEPVIARLWKEIQELDSKATTQSRVDAYLTEKGLVAVPVGPTDAMIDAFSKSSQRTALAYDWESRACHAYKAMIKAAPER